MKRVPTVLNKLSENGYKHSAAIDKNTKCNIVAIISLKQTRPYQYSCNYSIINHNTGIAKPEHIQIGWAIINQEAVTTGL